MTDAGTDVFISYARENRAVAQQLAEALASEGLRVWWDRDLPAGSEFSNVIEAQLLGARAVIVLWTADSVRSGFVRDESSRALKAGKLLPVRLDDIELPLGFGQIHTLDLLGWSGDSDDEAFRQLLAEVRRLPAGSAAAAAGLPGASPGGFSGAEAGRGGRSRWRKPAMTALAAAVLAVVVVGGKFGWDRFEEDRLAEQMQQNRKDADRHFRAGLSQQFAKEPALEGALNEYLSALELQPQHARAHYYLAHVYVQSRQQTSALRSFQLALSATEAPLDPGQRGVAQQEVTALAVVPDETAPVTRVAIASPPTPPLPPAATLPSRGTGPGPGPADVPAAGDPGPSSGAGSGSTAGSGPGGGPAPPGRPVRDATPAAEAARLDALVSGLFADSRDRRVTATTSLIVDPESLSDAAPRAVDRALAVLRGAGTGTATGGLSESDSSGIVNTLVLLQSVAPGTLEANRGLVESLLTAAQPVGATTRQQASRVAALLARAATRRPVAYLQIADESQRSLAEAISARLRAFGYDTPGIENVGNRAPQRTEVRVQGNSERGYARWVVRNVDRVAGTEARVSTLRNARPDVDTYEIWLARGLAGPPAGASAPL